MVDEKMNATSAAECLDTPDAVSVRRISPRDTFAAMRYRNYRIWFAGQLISLFGTWMQATAQGYLAYQLTKSRPSSATLHSPTVSRSGCSCCTQVLSRTTFPARC